MIVEVLTIGTELLLGEIVDTNSRFLAVTLKENGLDIYRMMTVGDNPDRIVEAIREALPRANALLLTGGLGPTVDDPTRAAAAKAAGVELVFHPELWESIQERFRKANRTVSENNRIQAMIPAGAEVLPNPVGTAPGFILPIGPCSVIAMPGVPSEMEQMMRNHVVPYLRERGGQRKVLRTRILHVAGMGESLVDEAIAEWERLANPTVGLAAHAGTVDIRIAASADTDSEAGKMISKAENEIRLKLGRVVYGADSDTLASAILSAMPDGGTLCTLESGTRGMLAGSFTQFASPRYAGGMVLSGGQGTEPEAQQLSVFCARQNAGFGLAVFLRGDEMGNSGSVFIAFPSQPVLHHPFRFSRRNDLLQWATQHAQWEFLQDLRKD